MSVSFTRVKKHPNFVQVMKALTVAFIQMIFFVILPQSSFLDGLLNFVSTFSLCLFLSMVIDYLPGRWLRFTVGMILLFSLVILALHHVVRGCYFSFALIYTNFYETFSWQGMRHIAVVTGPWRFSGLVLTLFLLCLVEKKYCLFWSKSVHPQKSRIVIFLLLVNMSIFALFPNNPSEYFHFIRSFKSFFFYSAEAAVVPMPEEKFPYVNTFTPTRRLKAVTPQYVFLVMIESLSGKMIHQTIEDGREVTPFLNHKIKEGLYFDRFYATSMQTERGHFATLCSIVPSFKKKVMTDYFENGFRCLPKILNENGFTTLFTSAEGSSTYDNEERFMRKAAFQKIYDGKSLMKGDDQAHFWGWGLQDDIYYRRVLDQVKEQGQLHSKKMFVSLATISSHQPFDEMPDDQKILYPHPKNHQQNYYNSIYLADKYLKVFFDIIDESPEFREAMVIVTGDHGFPTGMHLNNSNDSTYYDELFHVPLFIYWKGHVSPALIHDHSFSQMDIAPTILDFLNIKTKSQFQGKPLPLNQEQALRMLRPIAVFQPYDSIYLSSMMYPWKYVFSLGEGTSFVHNLETDPMEEHPLVPDVLDPVTRSQLKNEVGKLIVNQQLIEQDRIYPQN